jgi:hypothetical protein
MAFKKETNKFDWRDDVVYENFEIAIHDLYWMFNVYHYKLRDLYSLIISL